MGLINYFLTDWTKLASVLDKLSLPQRKVVAPEFHELTLGDSGGGGAVLCQSWKVEVVP